MHDSSQTPTQKHVTLPPPPIQHFPSSRVNELSLYLSYHNMTFKGRKAEKVAIIKAHIGSLLYNSMEREQPRQPPLIVQQQVTLSNSELETDSGSDVVNRIVGSSSSSSSAEFVNRD